MFIYRVKKNTFCNILIYSDKKNVQILHQFFEICGSFFGILGQKRKNLRKNKKDVFFRFPLKARGVFDLGHLVLAKYLFVC